MTGDSTEPTIHFRVRGRVQGVGFRYFARNAAREAGLRGWVRNLPDGSVEGAAQGDREALGRFLAALRLGPPGSRVSGVDTSETTGQTGQEEFEGFVIR